MLSSRAAKGSLKKAAAFLLSLMFSFCFLFGDSTLSVSAATSGTCGTSATFSYDSSTKTLTISGTGATKDYTPRSSKASPWSTYKTEIESVVINEGITEIGNYNFAGCTALTSVSLPSTLTSLDGEGAALVESTINGGGCFQGCTALEKIDLPDGLTTIEKFVFKGCTALTSITLPDSLTTLSDSAFAECTALTDVTFGDSLTATGDYAFYNSGVKRITWGAAVAQISQYSFYGCAFTQINIPDSVTSIGLRALASCDFLSKVTVNNANTAFSGNPCADSSQSITVYGHKGSTAETFATDNSYTFVSLDDCDHATTHEEVTIEATCTTAGSKNIVCDDCSAVVSTVTVAALGHNYEVTETVDSTETDGHIYTTSTCSRCGDVKETVEHQKLTDGDTDYVWIDGTYTYKTTATCTSAGYEVYTCNISGCSQSERHIVASAGHTVSDWNITAEPTCTTAGSKTGTCSVCNSTVTETIPATGHTYDTSDGSADLIETVDNTETDGHIHKIYKCSVCSEQVDVVTHESWVEGSYTSTVLLEPTCTVDGLQRDTCSVCGETRNVTIAANGEHEWYETTRTEPTCTATGSINYACKNCTRTKTEKIDALGHDYVKNEENSKAATCTEAGYDYYVCSRCSQSNQVTLAALGHTIDENNNTVVTAATCEESGSGTSVCSVCGETFDYTIDALGHNYEDVAVDLTSEGEPGHSLVTPTCTREGCGATQASSKRHDEWIEGYYTTADTMPSTCTVQGYTTDTCTICNTTRKNYKDALGHNYNITDNITTDGIQFRCSICLRTTLVTGDVLMGYWDASLLNSKDIHRTAVDNTSYVDANGDGIINVKDYVLINNASKKYAALVAESTSSPAVDSSSSQSGSDSGDAASSDTTQSDNT